MSYDLTRIRKPRCILLYALSPDELSAAEANRAFNEFIGDRNLPLVLFHDHFIGSPGGIAIFFTGNSRDREALVDHDHLHGWKIELRPLIFSYNPAAFDEQIAFTLRAYRGREWEQLRAEHRPSYGDPGREVEIGQEDLGSD
ncbi:MAG TPA: hypothetical protein VJL34_04920 [Anaerolineales bacterium]|nr:hypothetical protein [Anaerolineales bacterium]